MDHPYFLKHKDFKPRLVQPVHPKLGIVVVIPSYNEPSLWASLQALLNCTPPKCSVEIIVVVNYPEGSPIDVVMNANECIEEICRADRESGVSTFRFLSIEAYNQPTKHAGVGLARKIGMDEAAWRLVNSDSKHKIIACFDADATCLPNYLIELERLWEEHPDTTVCSIRYEHPLEGDDFGVSLYDGITQYELHLRYYVNAGKYIGHPFSYQTVGSSMACSTNTYMRVGGMNKNKAGEDFYFLQKIIPHGGFKELNTTKVLPSPRPSHRVPFGTGRAMTQYLSSDSPIYLTYNIKSFLSLKKFFEQAPVILFNAKGDDIVGFENLQSEPLKVFLHDNDFVKSINEINQNTSQFITFRKRFFLWFDSFKLLKYLNFANEHFFEKQPIKEAALVLLDKKNILTSKKEPSTKEILQIFRLIDSKEGML